jgi:4-hydroxy-2-oxoheptanedioate aldolase
MDIPRLNGIIKQLEQGKNTFVSFAPTAVDYTISAQTEPYDGLVFEMEHGPYDIATLRNCLQYLLNRRQIVESKSIAPAVTPMVRIPPNGAEMNQWVAKQVLDSGVYGIVWPHISTVQEAYNAVASCRYARPEGAPRFEPRGQRGDAPATAARYWGLTQPEYYERADVWPLDPKGEILVAIMCEDVVGMKNLPKILKEVPGIGCVIIGEGDLSQNLGFPAPVQPSDRGRGDQGDPLHLQGGESRLRPPARGREEREGSGRAGLHVAHAEGGADERGARDGRKLSASCRVPRGRHACRLR